MSADDDELAEFLAIFKEESVERLVNCSKALDQAQGAADPGPWLDEVDRELHTIKGSARLLGFAKLGKLVHDLEGLARLYRTTPALRGLLVEATDRLTALVEQAGGSGQDATDEALHARILKAASGPPGGGPGGAPPAPAAAPGPKVDPWTPAAPAGPAPSPPAGPAPAPGSPPAGPSGPQARADHDARDASPPPDSTTTGTRRRGPEQAAVAGGSGRWGAAGAGGAAAAVLEAEPEEKDRQRAGTTRQRGSDDETVRVRAARLEALDAVVSDLSLARLRFAAYEDRLRRLVTGVGEGQTGAGEVVTTLRQLLHDYRSDTVQVDRATKQLQQLAVDVRLRPVEALFAHIPREARDLARRLEKQVVVRIEGAETEMDRVILDHLKLPLGHLVRNALDHGLELPEERLAAGKTAEGTLIVRAGHEGGSVVIHVEDDGRGIDPRRIRQLAVTRGIIDESQAESMDDDDAVQLIFLPGFSTKPVATEISGRGIGMDVVRSSVEALKGDVRVHSVAGQGTRTTIRLPLTLLIARVTFVRSSGQQFAIPTEQLQESVRCPVERVTRFAGAPSVLIGGESLPLVRLAQVLGHRELADPPFLRVLVVRHGDERLALVVEELLEERSVVVKPLHWPIDRARFVSGAVHLPSGEVALMLSVRDLCAVARGQDEPRAVAGAAAHRRTVLVVDDSVVSRQMVGRTVEALGFDLVTALDGMDALRLLERLRPDLIVSDVEMPRLGGLGLARRLRADERLRTIPIIIVSSRGSEADRAAGLDAGADAYISKAEFNEATFRGMVERLL